MRYAFALSLGAFSIFTTSIAVTRQEQALAEQQFKNIQSLKGKKASEVIPSMQFMCASLKVECDFCHTADRASDEKNAKKTTREMIAMQNEINAKNFDGRLQVTCATCHAGHVRPVSLAPTEGIEVRTRRTTEFTPDQILAAYTKAVGSQTQSLGLVSLEGTSTGKEGKQKLTELRDGSKFMITVHGAKADQKSGFNGSAAWFLQGDHTITIPSQYATQFLNQQILLTGPSGLPKLTNPTAGTATIDKKDMLVLTGILEGSKDRLSIYFDKATGLPARLMFVYPTILGSMAQINDFSDYKKVGGVLLPMTIEHHSAEEDSVQHFTGVHVNPKIPAMAFDPAK